MNLERRCWAEVDLDKLKQNYEVAKALAPTAQLFVVVKANAYGHGDVEIAKAFEKFGAKLFAVSCLEEALILRRAGILAPILVLGYTPPEAATALAVNNLTVAVHNLQSAKQLAQQAQYNKVTVQVHLKVDTGMGRIGFEAARNMQQAADEMVEIAGLAGLKTVGMFTHFSVSDSAIEDDKAYTQAQFDVFQKVIALFEEKATPLPMYHCANSGATVQYPEMHLQAVRPGIILYGYAPAEDVPCEGLQPILTLKATVAQVKEVNKGNYISYGRTYQTTEPRKLATVTVGYADGYPRALSGRGVFTVNGKPAPVVGRVCMDQMVIDVTDCGSVQSGDEVIAFGAGGIETVEQVAEKAGTIPHEITCGLTNRVKRIYINKDAE